MSTRSLIVSILGAGLLCLGQAGIALAKDSTAKQLDENQAIQKDCVGCHVSVTPGIVKQHLDSKHAQPKIGDDEVRCHDCHGDSHTGMEDFAKADMPTLETCAGCHKKQSRQLTEGKHNLAWLAMKSQIAWHGQPGSITETGYRGCSGCHKIGDKSLTGVSQGNSGAVGHDNGEEMAKYRYGNAQ